MTRPAIRVLLAILLWSGLAQGHQELLFAHVSSAPPVPVPGEEFELVVRLTESSGQPISGLDLLALLSEAGDAAGDETPSAAEIAGGIPLQPDEAAGTYRGSISAKPQGIYRLTLVEVVEGRTEASASGLIEVGGQAPLEEELLLPPGGGSGLGSWLVWLVGLPLLAGLLVTLLVFTGHRSNEGER